MSRQPPKLVGIDKTNPLTNGLAFAYNPRAVLTRMQTSGSEWDQLDHANDVVMSGGWRPRTFNVPSGNSWEPSVRFNGLVGLENLAPSNEDPLQILGGGNFEVDTDPYTLMGFFRLQDGQSVDHGFFGSTESINNQFQIWADTDGGNLRLGIFDGTATYSAGSLLNDADKIYGITFRHDGSGAHGFIDGV